MSNQKPAAVVLAGGLGTRMKSDTPKHFHQILGRRMVDWVVAAARALDAEPRGTGDALAAARQAFGDVAGDLLVLSGDAPVVSPNLLRELLDTHRREGAAATILSFRPRDPRDYGRVIRGGN